MRTTIVPAQITTVEDKIAGNLNLTQVMLLLMPIFFDSGIYMLFPPYTQFAFYKLTLILGITLVCSASAIRFKERILVQWVAVLLRYTGRPRYYICNKNDTYHRDIGQTDVKKNPLRKPAFSQKKIEKETANEIPFIELARLDAILTNPQAKASFGTVKKGGMYVSVTEIK